MTRCTKRKAVHTSVFTLAAVDALSGCTFLDGGTATLNKMRMHAAPNTLRLSCGLRVLLVMAPQHSLHPLFSGCLLWNSAGGAWVEVIRKTGNSAASFGIQQEPHLYRRPCAVALRVLAVGKPSR